MQGQSLGNEKKYKAELVIGGQEVRTSEEEVFVVQVSHYGIFDKDGHYIRKVCGPKWVAMQVAKEMSEEGSD